MTQIGGESPLQATKAKIQAIIRQAKIDTQEREIKRRQTAEKHQQDGKALQQEAALEELRGREKGQSAIEAAKASAADSQAQQAQQAKAKQGNVTDNLAVHGNLGNAPDATSQEFDPSQVAGGGQGGYAKGPQPGSPGQQQGGGGMSPVGEAPPFLVDRQTTRGPMRMNEFITRPVTRSTTNLRDNRMEQFKAQQQQRQFEAQQSQRQAHNDALLKQQKQRDLVSSAVSIAGVTGDMSVAGVAAIQFSRGNTEEAFEVLARSGKTLPAQIAEARIAASNSTYNKNLLAMDRTRLQIDKLRGELDNLPLDRAGKVATLMKTMGELRKTDNELQGRQAGAISDRYGYPSSPSDQQLTSNELLIRTKELFKNPGSIGGFARADKFNPTMQANLDALQIENFNRGNLLSVTENDSKIVPTDQAIMWLDSVFDYMSGEDKSEKAKSAYEVAAKNLVDLGFSQGEVFNKKAWDADEESANLFLRPNNDNLSNATTADLLFKHWVRLTYGEEDQITEVQSLEQEAREMINQLMPQGTQ